jgi:hypothetical protein
MVVTTPTTTCSATYGSCVVSGYVDTVRYFRRSYIHTVVLYEPYVSRV